MKKNNRINITVNVLNNNINKNKMKKKMKEKDCIDQVEWKGNKRNKKKSIHHKIIKMTIKVKGQRATKVKAEQRKENKPLPDPNEKKKMKNEESKKNIVHNRREKIIIRMQENCGQCWLNCHKKQNA